MCVFKYHFCEFNMKTFWKENRNCNSTFFGHNIIHDFIFKTGQYLQMDLGGQMFPEMPKNACKNVLVIK